jgi:ABC-type lipopolysaccharide export system ATPase subunit
MSDSAKIVERCRMCGLAMLFEQHRVRDLARIYERCRMSDLAKILVPGRMHDPAESATTVRAQVQYTVYDMNEVHGRRR